MDDTPLRKALENTITGLQEQIPEHDPGYDEYLSGDDTRYEHLHWMLATCLENLYTWPTDKTSRWIGFVQGVQTFRGDMNSDDERDRTRPFFHKAYEEMGLRIPKTQEREDPKDSFDDGLTQ